MAANLSRGLHQASLVVLLTVLSAGTLMVRAVVDGQRALEESDRAFHQGDVRLSALHARRAASFYAPGAPHLGPAYARLFAIAKGAEVRGDRDVAVLAWNAVRSAALETRHLWIPYGSELARANANLARLDATDQKLAGPETQRRRKAAEAELQLDDAPRAPWVAVLGAGLLAMAVGLAWFGRSVLDSEGRFSLRAARPALAVFSIGILFWAVAAWQI